MAGRSSTDEARHQDRQQTQPVPFWDSALVLILVLRLALLVAFSSLVPLGEAPDEQAHLQYAGFIADNGYLPTNLTERQVAGYRAAWPPLYHLLLAGPLAWAGDGPPLQLKAVGDTPRRLIPSDGQAQAALIHTADEAWPWRGIVLGWHLGRFVSVGLASLGALLAYVVAWRVSSSRRLALATAAVVAFLPQSLYIGSVLNDDNLLSVLSSLIFLILIDIVQRPHPPRHRHAFGLGALLGLATVAKYNALPLWPLVVLWLGWRLVRRGEKVRTWLGALVAIPGGLLLTGGWWFGFVWLHFNQVERLGAVRGSLLALTAGTSDAALRRLTAGSPAAGAVPLNWGDWLATLYRSFWGLFGGGGAIALPAWGYWLLAIVCAVSLLGLLWNRPGSDLKSDLSPLLVLTPLLFLPLLLLRFVLTGGNAAETGQGRHLFPALPFIALGLVAGLANVSNTLAGRWRRLARLAPGRADGSGFGLELSLPALLLLLSLVALVRIRSSFPPPIPVRTTADATGNQVQPAVRLAAGVSLVDYEVGPLAEGRLPVTLIWAASATPLEDYLIHLTLDDEQGRQLGSWLGQPLGGRYPTRAWDEGDFLRHTIPVPLAPGLPAGRATLSLQLTGSDGQPTAEPLRLAELDLAGSALLPLAPAQLRADDLPVEAPFTYRGTLSYVLPHQRHPPSLVGPDRGAYEPAAFFQTENGSVAHFLVGADWPSGRYRLPEATGPVVEVSNRLRQFEAPPIGYEVEANFGGYLTLLGFDLPQRRFRPGDYVPLTLHWRAEAVPDRDLTFFTHLLDQAQRQRGGADRIPQNYYSTLLWVPGEIVSDSFAMPVEASAPAGVYWLDVGLYPTGQPGLSLPRFEAGQPIEANSVRLAAIKVGGPPAGLTTAEPGTWTPVNQTFGDQISLVGFDWDEAAQSLSLFWQAQTIPLADYTVFVHLLAPDGSLVTQADGPPASGRYPTSLWDPGEIVVDQRPLNLRAGRYALQVGLYLPQSGQRLALPGSPDGALALGTITVGE